MPHPTQTMAEQIAQAAAAFQQQRTGHEPKSVSVVLSGDTLVVTLHGALSPAERAMSRTPQGAAQVQEFHRQLFLSASEPLREDIKRITGMDVREAAAEVEPASGAVVQVFTSGTMVQVFLLSGSVPSGSYDPVNDHEDGTSRGPAAPPAGASPDLTPILPTASTHEEPRMTDRNSVVAIFDSHDRAEDAVRELQKGGVDMKTLSIIGKDFHTEEHVVGYYTTGERMKYWGKQGAFWGGFWGMLFGSAFFWVPGIGPLLVAGPLVVWMVGALESAAVVGGVSALGAALFSIGIPDDGVVQYETQVKNGKLLLVVHGTPAEVEHAKAILDRADADAAIFHGEAVAVGV